MNINLKLGIPLIDESGSKSTLRTTASLFLYPFYATEEDIYPIFEELVKDDSEYVRQCILNSSIHVNRLFKVIELKKLLKPSEIFSMKRDYVICTVTSTVAKKLGSDLNKKLSQSKSLGDFSVSTSYEKDSTIVSKIFSDSSKCVRELEMLIKDAESILIKPSTFSKASKSLTGYTAQPKLWWLGELEMDGYKVSDGFASYYYFYNGKKYKSGTLNVLNKKSNHVYSTFLNTSDMPSDDSTNFESQPYEE